MARRKRASMREGPLADLFRSTTEDETREQRASGESDIFDQDLRPDDPPAPPPAPPRRERQADREPGESRPRMSEGSQRGEEQAGGELRRDEQRGDEQHRDQQRGDQQRGDQQRGDEWRRDEQGRRPVAPAAEGDIAGEDVNVYRIDEPEPAESFEGRPPKERLRTLFADAPAAEEPAGPTFGREDPRARTGAAGVTELSLPVIRVVGVGGAGVNAVNRMVEAEIPGIEFLAVNTDLQSLQQTTADVTVHIGAALTRGLGSGSDPSLGFKAAFEEQDRIKRLLKGSDLVFVAAGAGGGTGTGAAPVIARLARDVGALTVGIVTRPFGFEGTRRGKQADEGVEALAGEVDTLIVIPNERLLSVLARNTSMIEAFRVADDVLRQGVQGIAELVTLPGLINLDFADVRTTMRDAGQALLGIGMGTGDNRAVFAAERAVSSPLLETSVDGARSILLSITGGPDLSLIEVSEAARVVQEAAHPDANIIFGANIDEDLTEQVWVTVIATRFDRQGRRADGSSRGLERDIVRPSGRRSREREVGSGTRSLEGRPRDLSIDVPEFIPSK